MSKMPHENGLSMLAEASVQAVPEPAAAARHAAPVDDHDDVVLPEPNFPFQCPACTRMYESVPGWSVHFKKYHPDLKMPRFKHSSKRKPKDEVNDYGDDDGTVEVLAEGSIVSSGRGRKKRAKKEDLSDEDDEYEVRPRRSTGVGRGRGRRPTHEYEPHQQHTHAHYQPHPPPPLRQEQLQLPSDMSNLLQTLGPIPDAPAVDFVDPATVEAIAAATAIAAASGLQGVDVGPEEAPKGRRGRKPGQTVKKRRPRESYEDDFSDPEYDMMADGKLPPRDVVDGLTAPKRHWKKRATHEGDVDPSDAVTLTLPNIDRLSDGEQRMDDDEYERMQRGRAAAAAARDAMLRGQTPAGRPRRIRKPKPSEDYEYQIDDAGRPVRPEGAEAESAGEDQHGVPAVPGAAYKHDDDEYEYSDPDEAQVDDDEEYQPYTDPDEERRHAKLGKQAGKVMPFKCPYENCTSAFVWQDHLQRHMVTHTGDKPFKCNVCGTAFTRRDHLTRHHGRFHAGRTLLSAEVGSRNLRQRPKEENKDYVTDYVSEDLEESPVSSSEDETDEEAEAKAMQELEEEAKTKFPVPNFIECETCGKWRRLSSTLERQVADGIIKFVCPLNDDLDHGSCEIEQEATNEEIDEEIAIVLSQQQAYIARRRSARKNRARRKKRVVEKVEPGEEKKKRGRGRQKKIKEEPEDAGEGEFNDDEEPVSEWSCCDACGKWRRLPPGTTVTTENWYCNMNPDVTHNVCDVPEEAFDDEVEAQLVPEDVEEPPVKPPRKKPGRKPKPKPEPQLVEMVVQPGQS
eukprot:TRINITY_DN2920_c0_g1_i2.p2 TRINITY_DN2920_c0_g1~~TRINITY_DN2920_c0_g1_i2.p2  ORF type:complete len:792 (+),score=342.19 TRINITY_DN2920_c0_g1_i2:168-2543(+)